MDGSAQWLGTHPGTVAAFVRALNEGQELADTDRAAVESAMEQYTGGARILETMQETVQGMRIVKAFSLEQSMRDRFGKQHVGRRKLAELAAECAQSPIRLIHHLQRHDDVRSARLHRDRPLRCAGAA